MLPTGQPDGDVHAVCDAHRAMQISSELLNDAALTLALVASDVANYCDHIEHCESADIHVVRDAATTLFSTSLRLGRAAERDAIELYAGRLGMIEERNVLSHPGSYDGASAALAAVTWRELQLVQIQHDRVYHPDVIGLPKAEQLRHYALHLSKLAGATVGTLHGTVMESDWLTRRVPDMLLFGFKVATVSGKRLTEEPLPRVTSGGSDRSAIHGS